MNDIQYLIVIFIGAAFLATMFNIDRKRISTKVKEDD